ncbi:GNAT family N-acetyltransferase [Salipaludibacillus daqingensis]|uniref:GNAT family N-acetyltransferase n=1 Tax=Salipaludibacillus daqingensis TaxID=3041001 RepID=UPI0024771F7C|nr:GNAT family N-acetyltransferase [Salipaludibacillus daqingensis]
MNKQINEAHISLLYRAFEKDPLFVFLFPNRKNKEHTKILIRFIIRRNRLLNGLILTDDVKKPSYVAIVDRPSNLRNISIRAKVRLNIDMLLLVFKLPFHVLRYLTKYQEVTSTIAPNEAHYYLTMIGVEPSCQGKGTGKKVLREIHDIAESSQPPYSIALDTENPHNVAYYKRFGYELTGTKIINQLNVYCMNKPAE